jgi:hypothetical protein
MSSGVMERSLYQWSDKRSARVDTSQNREWLGCPISCLGEEEGLLAWDVDVKPILSIAWERLVGGGLGGPNASHRRVLTVAWTREVAHILAKLRFYSMYRVVQ